MVFDEEKLIKDSSWGMYPGYDSDCYEVSESDHRDSCNKSRSAIPQSDSEDEYYNELFRLRKYPNRSRPPSSPNKGPPSKPRKAADAMKSVSKKCKKCGNNDHSSRPCAPTKTSPENDKGSKQNSTISPHSPPNVSKSSKSTDERACGACRETGHDRRTCPRLIKVSDHENQKAATEALQTLQTFIENMTRAAATARSPKKSTNKKSASSVAEKQTALNDKSKATASHMEKGGDTKARTVQIVRKSNRTFGVAGVVKKKTKPKAASRSVNLTINVD
ncbi:uncharacterized protein DFL_006008 [Arthrobotrys flagrans]|uniref:CCHC-type domain-containing protein n=1 Tax=Arthrobotrys flagrans TaxID=97331 RepID=A0A436ZZ07_ARTFL|nr:hypothetical protein DFL_006008 [Arthrobotrys flagrans]